MTYECGHCGRQVEESDLHEAAPDRPLICSKCTEALWRQETAPLQAPSTPEPEPSRLDPAALAELREIRARTTEICGWFRVNAVLVALALIVYWLTSCRIL